jgi:hypothetical protein
MLEIHDLKVWGLNLFVFHFICCLNISQYLVLNKHKCDLECPSTNLQAMILDYMHSFVQHS